MATDYEFTDRYRALGIPYPDPNTMCPGPCEGIGVYPENNSLLEEWKVAHAKLHSEPCDGWHFLVCPLCKGTRMRHDAD